MPFLLFFAAAQSLPEELDFDFDGSTSRALTAEPSRHEAPIPMERGLPFSEASLQPPSMPDPEDPAYRRSRDRPNGTTTLAFTLSGQAIQVSFWLAAPPRLSHLCVHCPGLEAADFDAEPTVVCSEKDIAIVRIHFSPTGPKVNPILQDQILYFVYKADQVHPSLDPVPVPYPLCYGNKEFGLLPATDGGFRIAALRQHPVLGTSDYDLHVFSSKTWAWSTRLARFALRPKGLHWCHQTEKVIVLDGSTLGFVDVTDGILCCRVDDEDEPPVLPLRLIRLPPPMHINRGMMSCSGVRDVVCIDGVIKFVEIASRKRLVVREQSDDISHNNGILHDLDLEELANNTVVEDTKDVYACDGWAMVTWNRKASSDRWLRDCQVDVNDVTVSKPRHLDLLPQLSISSHSGKLILNKNLVMSAPSFGVQDDGDVVFLMCKLENTDKDAWVVAVNIREKTLKDLAFYTGRTCYHFQNYSPYALSKHMDMAALNHSGRRVKKDDARTVPIGTAILVHGLDACVSEKLLVYVFTPFGELSDVSFRGNQQYALVRYVNRACAEEAMRRMNGNNLDRQKLAISWGSDTRDKQNIGGNKKLKLDVGS